MDKKSTQSVIPQGELQCVWMDAGVVGFKLCNQEYRCESCEFNTTLQNQQLEHAGTHDQKETGGSMERRAITADVLFKNVLKSRLENLRSAEIPQDRMYSRSHFWAQENESGELRIGMNHIPVNFFQPILSIVVSKAPSNISKNDPFCWIILPGGTVTLRSPVDAIINKFNPVLQMQPNILRTSPFREGWIMEITTKTKGLNGFSFLSDSQQHSERILRNIEHSFLHAFRHQHPRAGTTLFDGGMGITNIENILDPKVYLDVVNRIVHLPI
jgi:glycine cleavage system H protein